ncbi:MAG: GGDEF domain-containing protein [Gemmatimonadales bacterium]|nr:GGDEF domain-containing protein [Gemmatimonadales bacterium]
MSGAMIVLGIALIALGGWDQGLPNLFVGAGGFFVAWGLHRHLARRPGGSAPRVPHFMPDPALSWLRRAHDAIGVWALPKGKKSKALTYYQSVDPAAGLSPDATELLRVRLRSAPRDAVSGVEQLDTGTLVSESNDKLTTALLLRPNPSPKALEDAREDLRHLLESLGRRAVLRTLEHSYVAPVESVRSVALRLAHQIERNVGVRAAVALTEPGGVRVVAVSPGADQRLVGQVVPPDSPVASVARGEREAVAAKGDVFGMEQLRGRDRRRAHEGRIAIQGIRTRDATLGAVAYWRPQGGTVHLSATAEISESIRRAAPRIAASQEHEALGLQATLDPLTRLRNRRGFESVTRRVGEAQGGLIYADLDRFKQLNVTLGHAGGDAALVHFAEIVRREIRQGDVPGRIGGEEFAIWLPDASLADAMQVAERIRVVLAGTPWAWNARSWPLSASFGVAACPETTGTRDNLPAQADAALSAAKQNGRDRVEAAAAVQAR